MKIQYNGAQSFLLEGKSVSCLFDGEASPSTKVDFATFSQKDKKSIEGAKKHLMLPGEFEISGALIQSFYTDEAENIVFKVLLEEVAFVHFGKMKRVPESTFFENLGGNIDVIFISLSEDFDAKKVRDLLEKVEPRMAILGGDQTFFPKMVESVGAKIAEENPIKISRSSLSDDKTEVMILSI